MAPCRLPATFMRGGTSKALLFHARELPPDRSLWDRIFLSAMGSPDPHGRQLNGMGGGISSLSKVCIVAPSNCQGADIDYTFAQVAIKEAQVDYSGNCGNMSSAIGPFAVDEHIISPVDGETTVRIFNTNTRKFIHSTFGVRSGRAQVEGELVIPGVEGSGAPIRLDFLDPGGASTGALLPTGNATDTLDVPRLGKIEVSMVDAGNACVFVLASSLGMIGTEMPHELDRRIELLDTLAAIRQQASVAMGISPSFDEAGRKSSIPLIGFVSPSQNAETLSGGHITIEASDMTVRMISNGQPHRALPLTASVCVAVAAQIEGTTVFGVKSNPGGHQLRIASPSGVLEVRAEARKENGKWYALQASLFRTARRLFEGFVYF